MHLDVVSTLESTSFFVCTVEEQRDRAFTLALAALLGENVYNFGELVSILTGVRNDVISRRKSRSVQ